MGDKILARVIEELETRLGDEYRVDVTCQTKNNGVKKTGISICKKGERIGQIFYLKDIRNLTDKRVVSIAEGIINKFFNAGDDAVFASKVVDDFKSFGTCSNRIFPKVVNMERNRELLSTVPYETFLDLAVYLSYEVNTPDDGIMSIKVDYAVLEMWGVDFKDVYDIAVNNMLAHDRFSFTSLSDLCMGDDGSLFTNDFSVSLCNIQISNGANTARCMLNNKVMNRLTDYFGGPFILLPACVDGLIATPVSERIDVAGFSEIVQRMNCSAVIRAEEILSDHAYIYDSEKGWSW